MTGGAIISMLIGLVIPAITAVVTRASLPLKVRALVMLALSTVTGVVSAVATTPPGNLSGWEHLALNVVVTYLCAAAALVATWVPTGATKAIHNRTDRHFGIGTYDPALVL